jgi:hypothetical protein
MSDEYNDQKLIIENFNTWINEQEEELEEGIIAATMVGTYIAAKTLVKTIIGTLSFYDKLVSINSEIQNDENAPNRLKKDSQIATKELGDIGNRLKMLTSKLGWSPDVGLDAKNLSDEQMQQLLAAVYGLKNTEQQDEPESAPEVTPDAMANYRKLKSKVDNQ